MSDQDTPRTPHWSETADALQREGVDRARVLIARLELQEATIRFLWGLLDDIDTMGDVCKSDNAMYRGAVERLQQRRWETGITSDGYTLDLSGMRKVEKP